MSSNLIPSANLFAVVLAVALLSACAAPPPPEAIQSDAVPSAAKFTPAPVPSVHAARRGGTVGRYEFVIPPKAPPGTGAVPVSNSSFRGSIVTGIRESF